MAPPIKGSSASNSAGLFGGRRITPQAPPVQKHKRLVNGRKLSAILLSRLALLGRSRPKRQPALKKNLLKQFKKGNVTPPPKPRAPRHSRR